MRLHSLDVRGFGPFAGTVEVDFDALSASGLFLLSGATGAGKTSVLDAVCFALYGDVPGDRSGAKRLRSDQAAPEAPCEVTLEVTLAARRFRITRSPAHRRPKRRGTGLTTEPAKVSLSELVEGAWVHRSGRADETGHLVGELMGMNLTQFTQVALLPQGEFQAFLRAGADDRQKLLARLFRTARFEQVERWLRDRRTTLRHQTHQAHQELADVVSRVSEVGDEPLPDHWSIHDLSVPASDGELVGWLTQRQSSMGATVVAARESADEATAAEHDSRQRLEEARAITARRAQLMAAREEQRALQAGAVDQLRRHEEIASARRAAAVVDLCDLDQQTQARRHTTRERGSTLLQAALDHGLLPPLGAAAELITAEDPTSLVDRIDRAVQAESARAVHLRASIPRAARVTELSLELSELTTRRAELRSELEELDQRERERAASTIELRGELDEQVLLAAEGPRIEEDLVALEAQVAAQEEADRLGDEIRVARGHHAVAVRGVQDLRERWLGLKEARLESMAAEIAGRLAVGACCPVCGSVEHPDKASAVPGAADAEQERAALHELDEAQSLAHLRDVEVRDLETRRRAVLDRTGSGELEDPHAIRSEQERLRGAARGAGAAASRVEALREQEEAARRRDEDDRARRAGLERDHAGCHASAQAREEELRRLEAELSAQLSDTDPAELPHLIESCDRRVESGRAALSALLEADSADRESAQSTARLQTALRRTGFADPAEVRRAVRSAAEVTALEEAERRHDEQLAALTRILSEPGASETLSTPAPDLKAVESDFDRVQQQAAACREHLALSTSRVERLRDLARDLAAAHARWEPLHTEWTMTASLCSFVEGKAADNRWQMRLSAYVLAYRLTQVVDAANERLATMSDQRYGLVHTGQRAGGERRGGLGLLVRDDWSGETRDPATLSGGETFVVSLALALGLADVIAHEAGGAMLETLFVDEGFGSLDADTLDAVMDTLDGLRDGGRVVGVVSHVAEMRDRIPAQLVVTKSRSGSTLSLRG